MTATPPLALESEFEMLEVADAGSDPMLSLVSDLFSALHKECTGDQLSS